MTAIHVCPQSRVNDVLRHSGAGWAVSLLAAAPPDCLLTAIPEGRRLHLALSDITTAATGFVLAERSHVEALLRFLGRWDRRAPMLMHCYAGVSRSTAAALIALCALDVATGEDMHARRLRTASPAATPNRHLLAVADDVLGRGGRLVAAAATIGRGRDCFEGDCFALDLARVDGPAGLPA